MISLVITPNGASVYVSTILNSVQVLATSTNTIIATVPVVVPVQSAVTPDGDFVYVPSATTNTVVVIGTASNTVVATVPVGPSPNEVDITPNGASAYVANSGSNTVSVITHSY